MGSHETIPLIVEFTGGLEMLFSDKRKHLLQVPAKDDKGNAVTAGWLVHHLCKEVMKDTRQELFVLDGHVGFHISVSQTVVRRILLVEIFFEVEQALPGFVGAHPFESPLQSSFVFEPCAWQRQSLTASDANSRPGILVLINDADWELEGEASYTLQPNDNILFVSTLHGG